PAEQQKLLAADPVGITAHHGLEQLLVRQTCLTELSVGFEVAAGLCQDRSGIAAGRILVPGDDGGGVQRRQLVEGGDPFGPAGIGRRADEHVAVVEATSPEQIRPRSGTYSAVVSTVSVWPVSIICRGSPSSSRGSSASRGSASSIGSAIWPGNSVR